MTLLIVNELDDLELILLLENGVMTVIAVDTGVVVVSVVVVVVESAMVLILYSICK
jgi:hypothetical protein